LHSEAMSGSTDRVAEFLGSAERRLASRATALSLDEMNQLFEKQRRFGKDDDHAFSASIWL